MVLRMACPTRRTGSDNWYYRRTIPADVRRILEKLPKERRPRGWYKTHISISLGTADRAAAKTKCPEIAAEGPPPRPGVCRHCCYYRSLLFSVDWIDLMVSAII